MVNCWVSEVVFVVILCVSAIYFKIYLSLVYLAIYLRRSPGLEFGETEDRDPDSAEQGRPVWC